MSFNLSSHSNSFPQPNPKQESTMAKDANVPLSSTRKCHRTSFLLWWWWVQLGIWLQPRAPSQQPWQWFSPRNAEIQDLLAQTSAQGRSRALTDHLQLLLWAAACSPWQNSAHSISLQPRPHELETCCDLLYLFVPQKNSPTNLYFFSLSDLTSILEVHSEMGFSFLILLYISQNITAYIFNWSCYSSSRLGQIFHPYNLFVCFVKANTTPYSSGLHLIISKYTP